MPIRVSNDTGASALIVMKMWHDSGHDHKDREHQCQKRRQLAAKLSSISQDRHKSRGRDTRDARWIDAIISATPGERHAALIVLSCDGGDENDARAA